METKNSRCILRRGGVNKTRTDIAFIATANQL